MEHDSFVAPLVFLRPLPRCSIILRVVTEPDELFDGTAEAAFGAIDFGLDPNTLAEAVTGDDENITENTSAVTKVLMEVTYFHCAAGSFWNLTQADKGDTNSNRGDCKLCTEEMDGTPEVIARTGASGGSWVGGWID